MKMFLKGIKPIYHKVSPFFLAIKMNVVQKLTHCDSSSNQTSPFAAIIDVRKKLANRIRDWQNDLHENNSFFIKKK